MQGWHNAGAIVGLNFIQVSDISEVPTAKPQHSEFVKTGRELGTDGSEEIFDSQGLSVVRCFATV